MAWIVSRKFQKARTNLNSTHEESRKVCGTLCCIYLYYIILPVFGCNCSPNIGRYVFSHGALLWWNIVVVLHFTTHWKDIMANDEFIVLRNMYGCFMGELSNNYRTAAYSIRQETSSWLSFRLILVAVLSLSSILTISFIQKLEIELSSFRLDATPNCARQYTGF